ncbi:MAG: AI-2E family transporter [Oscillospiraceae bacterium]|nr:AI-2E family transporter [Oscillospiraceae bacterium]
MKLNFKQLFKIALVAFLFFLATLYWEGAIALIGKILGAASPLLIGAMIAYVVNILMTRYESWFFPKSKKKVTSHLRRPISMLSAYFSVIAVIVLVVWLIVPQLSACIQVIVSGLPRVFTNTVAFLDRSGVLPDNIVDTLLKIDWRSRIGQIVEVVTAGVGSVVDVVVTTVTSVFSGLVTALLALIFSIYLLSAKESLAHQIRRVARQILPQRVRSTIRYLLKVLDHSFHHFIVGQCTEAVILGVLCTIGMFIFRLPYATMIGALVAFTALIPVAGAYIGAIVGAFMILTVSPIKALGFLIFLIILQQLEGNIIYPKVVGSSIGLPGIWVLAAVTVGGGIAGVAGMLFGVPLCAAIYRIVREQIQKKEQLT